ncbi:hypothetical protein [Dongia sedimenti]|uniref:Uncharacterized protein n=1 Tax=Dongia sedimenti TaxID=3064282 RepID=A0ABU0YES9_9PROT|nr:hypothetical protein [Rhodospirillaceae bacterium R-7]
MADFQAWDRQLLPQGGPVAPQTGPNLADAFGKGTSDLVTSAAGAVESIRKTDDWRAEKEWDIDKPKAAMMFTDMQLALLKGAPDIKAQSGENLANYPEKIDAFIGKLTEEKLKDITSPQWRNYILESAATLRKEMVGKAIASSRASSASTARPPRPRS